MHPIIKHAYKIMINSPEVLRYDADTMYESLRFQRYISSGFVKDESWINQGEIVPLEEITVDTRALKWTQQWSYNGEITKTQTQTRKVR